jgi:uncharacterized protein
MNSAGLIKRTVAFVEETLKNTEGGHDWWHIYRVWNSAKAISKEEHADDLVVQLSALLHDIADAKFYNGDETVGPRIARSFLEKQSVDEQIINQVIDIIENISFKGGFNHHHHKSLELKVVQDADRLDAIGAIGIARAFNYGGFKNRVFYDPNSKPVIYEDKDSYKKNEAPTINHFYEKLLLLKDQMNTNFGKKLAQKRHDFMELYLKEFYEEWDGVH